MHSHHFEEVGSTDGLDWKNWDYFNRVLEISEQIVMFILIRGKDESKYKKK